MITGGSEDQTARVWEAATGQPVSQLLGHRGSVNSVAWSPDGRYVVTASEDHTARVWEPFRGKSIGAPLQHKRAVENAVWSPDGKTVLTGNDDDLALLWPAPTSLNGTPQQIALWLAVRTGLELDESGAFHVLDAAAWQTRRQTLAQLGRPPLP